MARVLVVDDDRDQLQFLKALLRKRGHNPFVVSNGFEALQLAEGQDFDVVVVDVEMPGMGGLETMQRLQEVQPDVPVILVSGYSALVGDSVSPSSGRGVEGSRNLEAVLTKELPPTALLGLIDSVVSTSQ